MQEWPGDLLRAALEAGAHVISDRRPTHAMHWASLQEFYRVRSTGLAGVIRQPMARSVNTPSPCGSLCSPIGSHSSSTAADVNIDSESSGMVGPGVMSVSDCMAAFKNGRMMSL